MIFTEPIDGRCGMASLPVLLVSVLVALIVIVTALGSWPGLVGDAEDSGATPEGSNPPIGMRAPGQSGAAGAGMAAGLLEARLTEPLDSAAVLLTPALVPQGSLFQIRVEHITGRVESVEGTFAGEPLHFRDQGESGFTALAAAPIDVEGETGLQLEVKYESEAAEIRFVPVPVVRGEYRMEELSVAPEFGRPQPPEIQARINEESARAMQVSRASHDTQRMWEAPFVPPRETRITSGFGHGRMFNDQVQSRHMGTDFGGGVGAPVLAPARGVVALVDAFYLGGNVIYVDHGGGLVTAYLHLSEQVVEEGDIVEPGQVIGRVGATGRVTGPHLHWIVRYGVITVDGMSLLELG